VRTAIARAGLEDRVRFLGPVGDMPALYSTADVVLMPSQTEASPIAALEALACGIPVLISAASNTDRVLVPGQHGWEIGDATVESIGRALQEIVTTPPAARAAMGAAARAHVVAQFTIDRVARDFMARYEALLAPGQPG